MRFPYPWIVAALVLSGCGGHEGNGAADLQAQAGKDDPGAGAVATSTPSPQCTSGQALAAFDKPGHQLFFPHEDFVVATLASNASLESVGWGSLLAAFLPAAQAAPPPVGAPGNQDLLERVRQADGNAARAAAGGTLPENIAAVRAPVAEALPCSEAGRQYQVAALQYLDALAADAACKKAFQAIPQPNLDDVNTLLRCQPTQALVAAQNRKAQLAAQVAAETCMVTAQTTPAVPPPVTTPPAAPPPTVLQTALANLLKGAANIAYGARPRTGVTAAANGTTDPVDLFSGTYVQTAIDLNVPALLPIELGRQYHSALAERDGPFGMGSGMAPYAARITVKTTEGGVLIKAAGTQLLFSPGDQTEVVFSDDFGTLEFTAFDKPGYAGARIVLQADAAGRLAGAQMLQPGGERFLFDAQGKLVRIEDRNGNAITLSHDDAQRITRIADPATGRGISLTYDGQGRVTRASGLGDQVATYEYDQGGRLVKIANALGQAQRLAYDGRNRLVTLTDARGVVTLTNVYDDDSGVVTGQILGDGSVIQLEYPDAVTRRVTDGNGSATVYRYHDSGLLAGITTPLGQTTILSYSPALFSKTGGARSVARTDGAGRTTTVELNTSNQPLRIVDPAGRSARFAYGGPHQLLSNTIDAAGRSTTLTRDPAGNVVAVTDAVGNRAVFTYTTRGQLASVTNPLGQTTRYEYDAAGNLTRSFDPLGNATSMAYDGLGRLTSVSDPAGNRSTYAWDLLNRLVRSANALGKSGSFAYDAAGNLTAITDVSGNTATIVHDAMNRPLQASTADGRSVAFAYDGAGNLVESTDAKGQKTRFAYDVAGRLTEAGFADGSAYRYRYDGLSRLSSIVDTAGQSWGFSYDVLDRITGANSPQGALAYSYDDASQLTQISVPGSNAAPINYGYDPLGQIIAVVREGNNYRFGYDCAGRRTALLRPSSVRTSYTYDNAGRLVELSHAKGGTSLQSHRYSYDAASNITRYVRSDNGGEITRDYRYDALNRLTRVDAAAAGGMGQYESADWEFDDSGNIIRKTVRSVMGGGTKVMTYDRAGRLISQSGPGGTLSFTYDANGNLVQDSSGRRLSWNARNQLTRLEAGGTVTSFDYDPLGRRTSMTTGNTSRSYFYSGAALLTNGEAVFLPGIAIDEALEMKTSTQALSFLQDHLGSTSALVDAGNGNRVATYHTNSYGAVEGNSTPLVQNPFGYTGREDDGNGLYYYRNRYYAPALEAFISRDPAGDGQRYAAGNPLIYTDPLGLEATALRLGVRDVIYDIAGGIADLATFGATKALRESGRAKPWGLGWEPPATIRADSPAYRTGQVALIAGSAYIGALQARAIAGAATATTVELAGAARGLLAATAATQRAASAGALAHEYLVLIGLTGTVAVAGLHDVSVQFGERSISVSLPGNGTPATKIELDRVTGLPVISTTPGGAGTGTNVTGSVN